MTGTIPEALGEKEFATVPGTRSGLFGSFFVVFFQNNVNVFWIVEENYFVCRIISMDVLIIFGGINAC
ncbi:hypothetical protein ACTWQL_08315 [Pseudalkalibacillus sp. R45]